MLVTAIDLLIQWVFKTHSDVSLGQNLTADEMVDLKMHKESLVIKGTTLTDYIPVNPGLIAEQNKNRCSWQISYIPLSLK